MPHANCDRTGPRGGWPSKLRYHYEQGLSARRWTVEEIFDPHLLDT